MKSLCILIAMAGLLNQVAVAQTASGSASGSASVGAGQAGASAKTSQAAQTPGVSADTHASAQGQVNTERKGKKDSQSGTGAGSGGTGNSAALASGTTLNAELTHSLDAKSAKAGDQVTARVTEDVKSNGKVVVHKGSKLMGHVTEARARTKDNADSRLGIVFDKAVLKSGQEVSFNGAMQAMAPPVNAALSAAGEESSMVNAPSSSGGGGARRSGGGGGGGLLGGATSTATGVVGGATSTVAGSTTGAVNGTTGVVGGLTAQGRLTSASQGAIGLQGLTLNSVTAGSAQGSVVSSTTRNVKLDSGTQMVLKVAGSAQ